MLKHALRTCYDLDARPTVRKRVSLGDLSLRRKSGTYENVQILKKYLRRRNSISWPNSVTLESDDMPEVTIIVLLFLQKGFVCFIWKCFCLFQIDYPDIDQGRRVQNSPLMEHQQHRPISIMFDDAVSIVLFWTPCLMLISRQHIIYNHTYSLIWLFLSKLLCNFLL